MTSARDQAVRSRNGRRPTDDELLDAARAVFARQGSHAGSMDAIAAHAGSTKPTLYAHFSDKETLYRRALEREAATLERHLADAYAAALALPPTEQVNRDTMAFFDYAIAHPDGFALLFGPHATGVALATRDALASALRERIAAVIHHARGHHRRTLGRSAEVVAAVSVNVAIEAARHALNTPDADLRAAGELASGYIDAALRHLDPAALHHYDAR